MSENLLTNYAPPSTSSPLNYFQSLLRKVKGRLISVHGLRGSPDSASLASSYATLPRVGTVKSGDQNKKNVIENGGNQTQQTQSACNINDCSLNNSVASLHSAQIFGTLPRPGGNGKKSASIKSAQNQSQINSNQNNRCGGAGYFALSRSGSASSHFPSHKVEESGTRQVNHQQPQPRWQSSLTSLTLPRNNGSYFWEEADATKQCRSLFRDCKRALDGVLLAVEKYFDAVVFTSESISPSSPSPSSHFLLPSFVEVTADSSKRQQEQQELFNAVSSAITQLFLILVELRNVLSQPQEPPPAKNSNNYPSTPTHYSSPIRRDFVTTALLIPVGALLSHLARLCDLLALSSGAALSPSDSGISMKSSANNSGTGGRLVSQSSETSNSHNSRAHPLKQQTIHVINSLRETLNRIDEGLPVVPVSIVRKSNSINDDLPVPHARGPNSLFKTTVTMNQSEDFHGSNGVNSNRSTVRLVLGSHGSSGSGSAISDRRGHNKLAQLEKNLKTVSFESAKSSSTCSPYQFDSGSESSPEYPRRTQQQRSGRSTTGFYDNVECYSPGPDYTLLAPESKPKDSTWSSSAEVFVNQNQGDYPREIPVVCTGAPAKPMSPNASRQAFPVWVCRQPDVLPVITPPAPLTPPSTLSVSGQQVNKRSCSQPPPNFQIQVQPTSVPNSGPANKYYNNRKTGSIKSR